MRSSRTRATVIVGRTPNRSDFMQAVTGSVSAAPSSARPSTIPTSTPSASTNSSPVGRSAATFLAADTDSCQGMIAAGRS